LINAIVSVTFDTAEGRVRKNWLLFILAIVVIGGFVSAGLAQKAPSSPDATIVPPDPSLPDEVKALSGKWEGRWNSRWGWDCTLYVERIDGDTARVVHSWGDYDTAKKSCHCGADWRRVSRAKVIYSEGQATIEFATRPYRPLDGENPSRLISGSVNPSRKRYTFTFTVDKNDPTAMKAHFISGNASQLRAEMKKVE
jgi:hypothetical protein